MNFYNYFLTNNKYLKFELSGLQREEEVRRKSIGPREGDVRKAEEEEAVLGRSFRLDPFRIDRRC